LAPDWRRTLLLMGILYATVAIGRSAAFPFLPLFYLELGVKPVETVALWAGATISVSFFMSALFAPFWGALADRYGRKPMVMRSCTALSISTALVAFVGAPWEVLALRTVAGIFTGFSSAATALVATQVPEEQLGYALGWLSTAQLSGSLIGPLLGGLLADALHQNYRAVFLLTSVVTLAATSLCGLFLHEHVDAGKRDRTIARPSFVAQLREILKHPNLVPMFVVVLLAQVCALGVAPIVPLFVRSMVDVHWVATAAGAAVAMTGIAGVIAAPFLGRRSDRLGYRRVLLISLAGAGAFTLPQSLAGTIWAFLALRFGVGLFIGGIMPTANALIGRMFSSEQRGRAYGITSSATFLGMAIGPIVGSQIMAHFGFHAVFVVIGSLMLLNLLWVATGVRTAEPAPG
jgi:MFS transporter, DHA1 family, multidrug resistance protein